LPEEMEEELLEEQGHFFDTKANEKLDT